MYCVVLQHPVVAACMQDNYDRTFAEKVYGSPRLTASEVVSGLRPSSDGAVRVQYDDLASFKTAAKLLGIMDDVKVTVDLSSTLFVYLLIFLRDQCYAFSALTLLFGRQEEHPACKNWVMRCLCGYLSGARCRLVQLMPLPYQNPIISCLI